MTSAAEFLRLPYTHDLTEGGIAYALHSLPRVHQRPGDALYDSLRRAVAGAAVELAFRRLLVEQNIPFEIKGAAPFTEPDRYDVALGNRRCEIKTFLLTQRPQSATIQRDPEVLVGAPALVASDEHAGAGHSPHDLYIFAFCIARVVTSQSDLQSVIRSNQPHYLMHMMPERWRRPSGWAPLGVLAAKSEGQASVTIELAGQDIGRAMQTHRVELLPGRRVEIQSGLCSLTAIHIMTCPEARIGLHSPARQETHLIGASDWSNLWLYGRELLLTGYLTHEEFSRHARFVPAGSQVFPYGHTHVKHLAVPLSELRPLSELFERVKTWSS